MLHVFLCIQVNLQIRMWNIYYAVCNNVGLVLLILLGWDSLGMGVTCVLYHCTMYTRHPDHVSFAFYAIPIIDVLSVRVIICIATCIHMNTCSTLGNMSCLTYACYSSAVFKKACSIMELGIPDRKCWNSEVAQK